MTVILKLKGNSVLRDSELDIHRQYSCRKLTFGTPFERMRIMWNYGTPTTNSLI